METSKVLRAKEVPAEPNAYELIVAMKALGYRFKLWPNGSINIVLWYRKNNVHEAIYDKGSILTVDDLTRVMKDAQKALAWCAVAHARQRIATLKISY